MDNSDDILNAILNAIQNQEDAYIQDVFRGVTPTGTNAFLKATVEGDHVCALEFLVGLGVDIHTKLSNSGETVLSEACRLGRLEFARTAIELGADVNLTDEDAWTPAMFAAHCGHLDCLQLVIGEGGSIHSVSIEGNGLLHVSASGDMSNQAGLMACIDYLLEQGLDLNSHNSEAQTPLLNAVDNNNHLVVRHLATRGADVNAIDKYQTSGLMSAVKFGFSQSALELLEAGAQAELLDDEGCTALVYACLSGNPESLAVLLEFGVSTQMTQAHKDTIEKKLQSPSQIAKKGEIKQCLSMIAAHRARASAQEALEELSPRGLSP